MTWCVEVKICPDVPKPGDIYVQVLTCSRMELPTPLVWNVIKIISLPVANDG